MMQLNTITPRRVIEAPMHASRMRTMYDFHEKFVTDSIQNLQMPGVDEALYGERDMFVQHLEGSFVPNVRWDGTIDIPEAYQDTEALPVVLIKPRTTLQLGKTCMHMTDTQLEKAQELGFDAEDIQLDRARYNTDIALGPLTYAGVASMRFHANAANGDDNPVDQNHHFLGRPIMYVKWPAKRTDKANPVCVVHEIQHVEQMLQKGSWNNENFAGERLMAEYELESYHLGSQVGEVFEQAGIVDEDDDLYVSSKGVDAVRAIGCEPDDPFTLTDVGNQLMDLSGHSHQVPLFLDDIYRYERYLLYRQLRTTKTDDFTPLGAVRQIRNMLQYHTVMSELRTSYSPTES